MAKPAGGPKAPQGRKDFDEDDWIWCCPSDVPLTPIAPARIHKTFSTCLFKAQQFGLFCRNGHTLVIQIICERKMYGWHCLLFMFLVPNKRHLRCHVMVWIVFYGSHVQFAQLMCSPSVVQVFFFFFRNESLVWFWFEFSTHVQLPSCEVAPSHA